MKSKRPLFLMTVLSAIVITAAAQRQERLSNFDIDSVHNANVRKAIGSPFPAFSATHESGKITNASLKGKVVLINFWFEDCRPCITEFSALNEIASLLKPNKDFEFISFTRDSPEAIKRVKNKYKLQFKVFAADDIECRRLNQNNGYPTTIILDRQGVIRYLIAGGQTDEVKAKEYVMTVLLPEIRKLLLN